MDRTDRKEIVTPVTCRSVTSYCFSINFVKGSVTAAISGCVTMQAIVYRRMSD